MKRFRRTQVFIVLAILMSTQSNASTLSLEFSFNSMSATFPEIWAPSAAYPGFGQWQNGVVNGTTLPFNESDGAPSQYTQTGSNGIPLGNSYQHVVSFDPGATSVLFSTQNGWTWEENNYRYEPFPSYSQYDNVISFNVADTSNENLSGVFKLGTFSITNGSWFSPINGGFNPTELGFTITTVSDDSLLNGHVFSGTFMYRTAALVGGTDLQNADEYWIKELPELGSARVYEYGTTQGNTGSFDVYGYLGSLHVSQFANASGGLTLTPTLGDIPSSVPLPGAFWLLLSGLGVLLGLSHKKG